MKKIALVTGASSGLGMEMVYQIAEVFPSLEEIWVNARREDVLKRLEAELPGRIRSFPGDITQPVTRKLITDALEAEQAHIMVLVNAAGFGKIGREGTLTEAESAGMIRVNCEALTLMTEACLPYLTIKSRVINFASAAAFLPQPGFAVYAATKAYVLSYSRALGKELAGRGIKVTAVCPGPVDTEFFPLAEEHASAPVYKKLFMSKTEDVAARALADSRAGKTVSVYGGPMKLFRLLAKLVPTDLLLKFF